MKLHKPPPQTKLELQLNYRKIILNKQMNTGWREAFKPVVPNLCGTRDRFGGRHSTNWELFHRLGEGV